MTHLQNKHLAECCEAFILAPNEQKISKLKNICLQLCHEENYNKDNLVSRYEDDRAEFETVMHCLDNHLSSVEHPKEVLTPNSNTLSILKENAKAIVLVVLEKDLKESENTQNEYMVLNSEALKNRVFYINGEKRKLCLGAKFIEQRSAYCLGTGFFINNSKSGSIDTIMTAAHVLYPPFFLEDNNRKINIERDIRFIKGFKIKKGNSGTGYIKVPKSNIYKPVKSEERQMELTSFGADWAKIKVKPEYENLGGKLPHKGIMLEDSLKKDTDDNLVFDKNRPVYCLGHGLGLALKIAYDGRIIINDKDKDYFECNLDLFSGNSGSPIFDAISNKAIGMVVRGESEFILNKECIIPSVFSNQYRGEECQRLVIKNTIRTTSILI